MTTRKSILIVRRWGMLTFSDIEITLLSPHSTDVVGRWKLQRAKDRPHGLFTLIFKRLPEGWRIVLDHTSAAARRDDDSLEELQS